MTTTIATAPGLRAHARKLAEEGFRVFPCHAPTPDGCSCEQAQCSSPGKHPRTPHGCKDATVDRAAIEDWWERWPTANIAVATGAGLIVIDVDGPDAQAILAALASEHGGLPETRSVLTGRAGGLHLWFRSSPEAALTNTSGRLGKGIDTRGAGGYVMAPPSLHPSGRHYSWRQPGVELAELPAWMVERLVAPRPAAVSTSSPAAPIEEKRLSALGEVVLDRELAELAAHPTEPNTGRGSALYGAAVRLGRIVAAGGLELATTWQALIAAGEGLGLNADELDRSVDRGLAKGLSQPLELADRPLVKRPAREQLNGHGSRDPGLANEETQPSRGSADDPAHDEDWAVIPDPIPPPFPIDAFPETVAAFVRAVSTQYQTAPDLAAMGALGVLASVAMNARVDCVNWDEETLGLYLLVASPTGDRKSTIMKKVAAPLYRLEREAQQDAIAARARWESEREILQARKQAIVKKLNKLKDDADPEEEVWGEAQAELEQISAELARIGEFPEPGMIAGDSTPEALVDLMAEQKDGVAVLAAEAAPIDNLFGRYSDDGNSNLSAVCEAYTADPIRVGRRGRPKLVISRPLLTITLFAQEDVLEKVAAHGKARTQGFIGRFALVDASVTSYVGHRQISPPPAKTPAHLHEAWDTVVRRAQTLLSATQPTKTPSEADSGVSVDSVALSEVTISTLTLSPTSKKLLTEIELATEPRLRAGADLEFFRDWMSRHHGRVARVAALLHLAEGRSPEEPIAIDVMGRAARIGEYLFAHALRVVSSPDPLMRRAKAWLAEQLAAGAGEVAGQIISQRELHRGVLGAHGPSTEAAELAARLVEHGALRPASAPAPKDPLGRGHHPSPRFEINPHLRAR